jgi:hypothetical protein
MNIEIASAADVLMDLATRNAEAAPELRGHEGLTLSPLIQVRSSPLIDCAEGHGLESASVAGLWAFVLRDEDVVGIAELTVTPQGVVYAGVNRGRRGIHLNAAEVEVGEGEAYAWIFHAAPLFYTAVVIDRPGSRLVIPTQDSRAADGSPEEILAARARNRLRAAEMLMLSRLRRPTAPADQP